MKRTFTIFLLTLLCLTSVAQKRCRIFGMVKDDNGSPIELAAIRVSGTLNATTTDLKGKYSIYVAQEDSVTLLYSMIGYESRKRQVVRPTADSLRIDVMLPLLNNTLGTAVVRDTRIQTGTTQIINLPDAHLAPSTTGNGVEEMIATQAGVSTHSELSSQYNVRGGSFDENCVYLNGFEIYRPMLIRSGQQEGLSIINSDMVQSVGFSSGGFEARYGDKMSSVLDITYKHPEKLEVSANASLLGAGAYLGIGNEKVSFMGSVRYKTTGYLLNTFDTNAEYKPNFLDFQGVFSYRPSKRWNFELIGNYSDNSYQFTPHDRTTSFGTLEEPKVFTVYFDGWEKDFFRTLFGAASITHNFNPDTYLALQFSTYATKEEEAYDISGEYWLNEATGLQQFGVGSYMEHARNRLRAQVYNTGLRFRTRLTAHTLQAGLNYSHQRIAENSNEWEMRDSVGYSLPHSDTELRLIYALSAPNLRMINNKVELFAQDTWRLRTKIGLLNLTYGLRFTYNQWNKEPLFSPRISVGFLPEGNSHWVARFATGIYYQAPFYKEVRDTTLQGGIAQVTLNRDIKSQRSIHFVLGTDYSFHVGGRPFKFTAEAYYKHLSNLIPYNVDNVRVVYYGRNMSNGYATGLDLKLFGEFVEGNESWVTFSLMSTKEKLDGKWLPRPTDQLYALNLHFTDYFARTGFWSRFGATLRGALAAGLPFGPPHKDRASQKFRAPMYKRVDLGINFYAIKPGTTRKDGRKWPLKEIVVGVDCFNIFGFQNVNSYYWVTDITNTQYAVPNYLTGRLINARVSIRL